MLPIVIRSTEEMLRLVPDDLREASFALGATQEPHDPDRRAARGAARHRVSGCLLAVARAAGETAPLLFTIGVVTLDRTTNLFEGPNTALSTQIFAQRHARPSRAPRTGRGARRSR